ncbi:MAG: band 7 protein [Planctomycetes bacterium]|nr:band 7 protein [Planctomycetota bacterium]
MTKETPFNPINGWFAVLIALGGFGGAIWTIVTAIRSLDQTNGGSGGWALGFGLFGLLLTIGWCIGFFIVNPNDTKVMVLFGTYKGTTRHNGFWWANPFMLKTRVTIRARNLEGEQIKVNDKVGNPIEISAVVVWKVDNTAQALFDVDDYVGYVSTQSEAAVRQLAGTYPYDTHDEHGDTTDGVSLREGRETVNRQLEEQLKERLGRAGVTVIEARLTHLAYAPEIAGAMLQRQQAAAVVAARKQIVDGAVGMVDMALQGLAKNGIVELDEERKAAMVSNLLVVLCGDRAPHPVVNTGTLYA